MKRFYCLLTFFFLLTGYKVVSQDFIRIGAAHDFKKSSVLQTFSFDFNRTEKIDEKKGKFLLFDKNNFYILPTTDVNLGDGITASENNVLFQINAGKAFFGNLRKSNNNLTTSAWNKAIEFNPSYNGDKSFVEKLAFTQIKLLLNFISATHSDATPDTYVKSVFSFAPSMFTNIGYRNSKSFGNNFYSTAGMLMDFKLRLLNKKDKDIYDNWILKLSGNYYYILSEVKQLTSKNYAGILKASIDKNFYKSLYLSFTYKYGNDNPTYSTIHTLELAFKVKY